MTRRDRLGIAIGWRAMRQAVGWPDCAALAARLLAPRGGCPGCREEMRMLVRAQP